MTASFIPDTTKFSAVNALRLGEAAALAYESRAKVAAQARLWGMESKFIQDKLTDTQAFVAWDIEAVIVAFRGTEKQRIQDIAVDAAAIFMPGRFGRVHAGFETALSAVWDRVTKTVRDAQTGGQSLWFTGHSLGGALAALAAARYVADGRPVYGLYTFGQPRVGDQAFADTMNVRMRDRVFRYVNRQDVVPRVPPRVLDYSDVGECFYFNADGDLRRDPADWYRLLDGIPVDPRAIGSVHLNAVGDHGMDRYLVSLRRAARSEAAPQGADVTDLLRRLLGGR